MHLWELGSVVALRPTGYGINNQTFFVDTSTGTYFLRVYQNTRDPTRVRYEHAILRALQGRRLSFVVPGPVSTRDGDTLATLPDGQLAALFDVVPGEPSDFAHPDYLASFGEALGELHVALAGLDLGTPSVRVNDRDPGGFGAMLPEPSSVAHVLNGRVVAILADLRGKIPAFYADLPTQLCHNDYAPGNTLQLGGRISAVLDFEFAGPDVRAIEVATGWYWAARWTFGTGDEMAISRRFFDAYRLHAPLSTAEVRALPTAARLQRAGALVHWLDRSRVGLDPQGLLPGQIDRLVALDAWLAEHGDALISLAGG